MTNDNPIFITLGQLEGKTKTDGYTLAKQEKLKPSAIIAHTVKGKGISFM